MTRYLNPTLLGIAIIAGTILAMEILLRAGAGPKALQSVWWIGLVTAVLVALLFVTP